jgi:very-short-patch-repair endonuclease
MNNRKNSRLTANAQTLRNNMTKEERHLWYDFLKDLPITFNRQKVIGDFIADFYCASKKLIIELDGSQLYEEQGIQSDAKRDEYFRRLGKTVKRYSNADINLRFESVCADIYNTVFPPAAVPID